MQNKNAASLNDARKMEKEERRARVVELRLQHHSIREIAALCGVASVTIQRDLKSIREEWAERRTLSYEQLVEEELERLAAVERSLYERVMSGDDDSAVDRWLKIVQERIRILGLHAPKEHKIVTESVLDAELEKLNQELAQFDALG